MVKVAIVSSSFPPLSSGGISSAHFGLLTRLRKQGGYQVKGFSFLDDRKDESDSDYGIIRSGTPKTLKFFIAKSKRLLASFIFRDGISYQFHDILMSFFGSLIASFKIRKFNPDVVIVSDHGCPMLPMKYLVKSKFIWASHHNPARFLDNPLISVHSKVDARFALDLENRCIPGCIVATMPSFYMEKVFIETYRSTPATKVIPNAIDITLIEKIEAKLVSDDKLRVFIPSAGSSVKGERYIYPIISAVSQAIGTDKIQFLLSGNVSEQLAYEVQNCDIDVVLLGQNPYEVNLAYLKSCNLLLSPTLLESYGMAILEAGLCGVPSVAFNVGGNSEIIKEGFNGSLVDYLDINGLCSKAVDMLRSPLDSESVAKYSNDIYDLEAIDRQWISLIDEITQR